MLVFLYMACNQHMPWTVGSFEGMTTLCTKYTVLSLREVFAEEVTEGIANERWQVVFGKLRELFCGLEQKFSPEGSVQQFKACFA